ncbi:MAG: Sua5 family C-terminal domain-containing protein, partial [Opitutaceae bacterium]
EPPRLLRPGRIGRKSIEGLIGPIWAPENDGDRSEIETNAPKAPGQLLSHYAPRLPVRLNAATVGPGEALLAFGPDRFIRGGAARDDGAIRENLDGRTFGPDEGGRPALEYQTELHAFGSFCWGS